jgi:DNA repair exonuclease SbcCD ATPase subunit
MINFDDLGKKLGETVDSVSAIAGKSIEIQKLRNQVRNLERGNALDIQSLGRMVYQGFIDGAKLEEKPQEICEGIKSREEGIEELLQKISLLKGVRNCPNCGKAAVKEMSYCPYCGTELPPLPEDEEVVDDEVVDEPTEVTEVEEMAAEATEEAGE